MASGRKQGLQGCAVASGRMQGLQGCAVASGRMQGLQGCAVASGRAPGWASSLQPIQRRCQDPFRGSPPSQKAGGFRSDVSEELFQDKG